MPVISSARSSVSSAADWFLPHPDLQKELKQIEARILHQASLFDPGAETYVRYALEGGGKRLRPALVLLAGKAAGGWIESVRDLAVIVELVHVASLIHDDILDQADLRRSRSTCNAKWGAQMSVLLGDALFAHGLQLATQLEDNEVARKIAEASRNLCEGEILQTQRRFDLSMATTDYLHVAGLKTGALFRVAAEAPFILHQAPASRREAARCFGYHLGIAYQIYDDVVDLMGTEKTSGKTLGTDLKKGKWTLPVLHALQAMPPPQAEILRSELVDGKREVVQKICDAGGIKFAMRKAADLLERAAEKLDLLGDPDGQLAELVGRLQALFRQVGG